MSSLLHAIFSFLCFLEQDGLSIGNTSQSCPKCTLSLRTISSLLDNGWLVRLSIKPPPCSSTESSSGKIHSVGYMKILPTSVLSSTSIISNASSMGKLSEIKIWIKLPTVKYRKKLRKRKYCNMWINAVWLTNWYSFENVSIILNYCHLHYNCIIIAYE